MTMLIYVDRASKSETPSTSRSSPPRMQRQNGSRKTTLKASRLSTKFWNERGHQLRWPHAFPTRVSKVIVAPNT
jgi:hypothetical protein